jgi:hypothetical protein
MEHIAITIKTVYFNLLCQINHINSTKKTDHTSADNYEYEHFANPE